MEGMKRVRVWAVVAVVITLLVCGICAVVYFGDKSDMGNEERAPLTDNIVLYVDIDKLVTKSAIRNVLTNAELNIIAGVIAVDGVENTEYVLSMLENFDNIGLNSKQPIYGYLNMNCMNGNAEQELTIVAEVSDITKLDRFANFALANFEDMEIIRDGDLRVAIGEEFVIGYNNRRLVVVNTSDGDALALLSEALSRPWADLSAYAKYDIACSVRLKPVVSLMYDIVQVQCEEEESRIEKCTISWERAWLEEQLASSQKTLSILTKVDAQLAYGANMLMGVVFYNGRAVADVVVDGYNAEFKLDKKVSNGYLKSVDENAIVVANMGVNGNALSALISKLITPYYADVLGVSRNQFNIYVSILCDAIKSINGDVTLAINNLYGNYYGVTSMEALVAMDVADDYIISNISRYGAGLLGRDGENRYSLSLGGFRLALGQQVDTFYAAVNMDYKDSATPASEACWSSEVADSYGYVLVNMDSAMSNSVVTNMWSENLKAMDDAAIDYLDYFVKASSYMYITANTPSSAQIVVVFDDAERNALEQIVTPLVPVAVRR